MEGQTQWTAIGLSLRHESPKNFNYYNALEDFIPHSPSVEGVFDVAFEGEFAVGS